MIVLCDKGLAGREMERYAADQVKVLLARPDRKDEPRRFGSVGGMRQWIESVNDTLKGQLDLERHGGRTPQGLYTRITQRLLAMAATIWHNWAIGASLRSLTAYDHRSHKESLIQGLVAAGIRLCGEWATHARLQAAPAAAGAHCG